jgi:hypothetical protein
LGELAQVDGGTVIGLLRQIEQRQEQASISESTAVRFLKEMKFTDKRYRYSLKKTKPAGIRARRQGNWGVGPTRS